MQDYGKAANWYRSAADRGHPEAQDKLKVLPRTWGQAEAGSALKQQAGRKRTRVADRGATIALSTAP